MINAIILYLLLHCCIWFDYSKWLLLLCYWYKQYYDGIVPSVVVVHNTTISSISIYLNFILNLKYNQYWYKSFPLYYTRIKHYWSPVAQLILIMVPVLVRSWLAQVQNDIHWLSFVNPNYEPVKVGAPYPPTADTAEAHT